MSNKNENILIRVTEQDKEYIKQKAEKMGFKSVTAFLVSSAKNHFTIEMDMKIYSDVAKEINYIGKNINSLVRKVNSAGFYSDNDMEFLKTNQKIIIDLMKVRASLMSKFYFNL